MQMLPTHDWLAARAAATPRKPALLIGERRWRYAELDTAVSRLAAHLHARGVRPGDHLGMLLPNGLTAVCLVHAAARLGAILVPLNTRLTPAELARQAAHTDARIVYSPDTAAEWLTVNSQWLMVNDDWHTTTPLTVNHLPLTNNHLQSLIFTSGTSGHPKAAMLTFANHFWSATASASRLGVQPDDLWLSVLPLYHVGGLAVLFRSCLYGTAVDLHPRFDLDAINHALDTRPITLISLVPTMLHRLLATRTHWPASLRLILLGGAAAPPELVAQANALPRKWFMVNGKRQMLNNQLPFTNNPLPLIAPTYGLTEAASQVATMLPADAVRKPGSVGRPFLFTTIRIVDEAGRELPPGEPGEIVVSGPTVMAGYYEREPLAVSREPLAVSREPLSVIREPLSVSREPSTAAAPSEIPNPTSDIRHPTSDIRHPTSQIHTGDVGYLDADGDLFVLQRRSDLIVSGGENVYPAEVEAVLRRHPAVAAACVVGLPDAEWGQRVAAMVQLAPDTAVSPAALIAFCRQHLAGYKIPRHIQLVDALPLTASGKIARKQIADLLKEIP